VGAALIVSSVPILIIAGSNKRKAMSFSIESDIYPHIGNSSLVSRSVPSLSLKIGL